MTNKKDPDELRERIKDIVHKTYKHNDTTELLEDIAADELLALISTEQDKAILKELKTLKAEWDKWLVFEDDDPNDPVPLKDIIAFFEERIKELERRLGDETLKFKQ